LPAGRFQDSGVIARPDNDPRAPERADAAKSMLNKLDDFVFTSRMKFPYQERLSETVIRIPPFGWWNWPFLVAQEKLWIKIDGNEARNKYSKNGRFWLTLSGLVHTIIEVSNQDSRFKL
jgi:hypothetical protein